jgi:hypothetical protein
MTLLKKVGELGKPCPRCRAESSVDLYFVSRPVRLASAVVLLATMAGRQWDRERAALYEAGLIAIVFFQCLWDRAICRACGARLSREIGEGWR